MSPGARLIRGVTREAFEAKVRSGAGMADLLDRGVFVIVACDGTHGGACEGWRLESAPNAPFFRAPEHGG